MADTSNAKICFCIEVLIVETQYANSYMPLLPHDIKDVLGSDETVIIVAMQKRVGFGGALINQEMVIITNKRIIIGEKRELGLRTAYKFIPFGNILNVKIEHGITPNAIILSTWACSQSETTQRIDGLRYNDTIAIFNHLTKQLMPRNSQVEEHLPPNPKEFSYLCR
ncbi:MAG: PH domain-containing protein [Candidatus Micrarchaeia archaeon]